MARNCRGVEQSTSLSQWGQMSMLMVVIFLDQKTGELLNPNPATPRLFHAMLSWPHRFYRILASAYPGTSRVCVASEP